MIPTPLRTTWDMTPISKFTVPICIIRHSSYWLLIVAKYIHLIILCLGTGDGQGNDSSGPTNNKKASCGTALEASRVGTFETSKVFLIKNVLGLSTYKIPSIIKPLSYTNFFSWQSSFFIFLWVSDFNEVITYCNSVKILNFVI